MPMEPKYKDGKPVKLQTGTTKRPVAPMPPLELPSAEEAAEMRRQQQDSEVDEGMHRGAAWHKRNRVR